MFLWVSVSPRLVFVAVDEPEEGVKYIFVNVSSTQPLYFFIRGSGQKIDKQQTRFVLTIDIRTGFLILKNEIFDIE